MQKTKMTYVKIFLEADTKEGLVSAMLENNFKRGTNFPYGDPVKDGETWVVWYYDDVMDPLSNLGEMAISNKVETLEVEDGN